MKMLTRWGARAGFLVVTGFAGLAQAQTAVSPADRDAAARAAYARGDTARATEALNEAVRLNPFDPVALNNLAVNAAAQGDYPNAVMLLERALRLAPNRPDIVNNLANLKAWMAQDSRFSVGSRAAPQSLNFPRAEDTPPELPPLWAGPQTSAAQPSATQPVSRSPQSRPYAPAPAPAPAPAYPQSPGIQPPAYGQPVYPQQAYSQQAFPQQAYPQQPYTQPGVTQQPGYAQQPAYAPPPAYPTMPMQQALYPQPTYPMTYQQPGYAQPEPARAPARSQALQQPYPRPSSANTVLPGNPGSAALPAQSRPPMMTERATEPLVKKKKKRPVVDCPVP